jgi:hypothetical protein
LVRHTFHRLLFLFSILSSALEHLLCHCMSCTLLKYR